MIRTAHLDQNLGAGVHAESWEELHCRDSGQIVPFTRAAYQKHPITKAVLERNRVGFIPREACK